MEATKILLSVCGSTFENLYKIPTSYKQIHQLHSASSEQEDERTSKKNNKPKMKFYNQIILVVALAAVYSQAAITRPDEVLVKLDEIETKVFGYQAEIKINFTEIRTKAAESVTANYKKSLTIIEDNVKAISVSDGAIREVLSAEPAGACITNLNNFLDQIIEMSGYYVSNCLIISDNATIIGTNEFWSLLESRENELNIFANIFINALIGRNIFTESDAIVARVEELFGEKSDAFKAYVTDLQGKSALVDVSWAKEIAALEVCFEDITSRIESAIGVVSMQIPSCKSFNSRGARSAIQLDAKLFFPPL